MDSSEPVVNTEETSKDNVQPEVDDNQAKTDELAKSDDNVTHHEANEENIENPVPKEDESMEIDHAPQADLTEQPVVEDAKTDGGEVVNESTAEEVNGDVSVRVKEEPVPVEVNVKSPEPKLASPTAPSTTPPQTRTTQIKKPKVDLQSIPTRQYLDTTVVPILLQGLSAIAKERPPKPIAYLANFLQEKSVEYDEQD